MEIVRHQSAQLAEGFDPSAAPLEGEMRGILGNVSPSCGLLDGGPRRRKPRVDTLDQVVGVHAPNVAAVFCGLQAETQNSAITADGSCRYAEGMPYDPEKIRRAARRIMREKKLKMSTWSARAKKGERTFAQFMAGATASPRVETIYQYAEAAGVDPAELLGLEPTSQQAAISASAIRTMMALLERVEREQALSGEALQNIRELAAAIAADLHPS